MLSKAEIDAKVELLRKMTPPRPAPSPFKKINQEQVLYSIQNNMTFLPEDYKQPEIVSNYLKFKKDGETDFRILSDSIVGYIYFNTDNKPARSKDFPEDWKLSAKTNENSGKQDTPKHFRAFVVWDYANKKIAILEVTQKSIQNDIMAYYKNTKRGDPKEYDLTVTRKGEGLETKYTVIANPKTPLTEEQAGAYLDSKIDLNALYDGEDPFTPKQF